jgi:hypothetical protein
VLLLQRRTCCLASLSRSASTAFSSGLVYADP